MVIAIILILCLSRKSAIVPLLLAFFITPTGQVVVLGGVHFTVLRILILAGLARRAFAGKTDRLAGGFNSVDFAVTGWALMLLVVFSLQWMDMQAFIMSLGNFLDALGGYMVIRFLIRDREDVRLTLKVFACLTVILGVCMINEQITHQNIFGLLGGVEVVPQVRDGHVRSQATFGTFLEAGVFGGILIPMFIGLWREGKSRGAAFLGLVGATVITVTSNTSTALLAYAAGLLGLCFWPMRKQMRLFRWGLVAVLVALHMVMKAPVWALIARIDLTGSSSGWHRLALVDQCIRHFGDWWLLGYKNYNDWGWDLWDLSNQFVATAFAGGLVTLVFFIAIFSRALGGLGKARKLASGDRKLEWLIWSLGASLFALMVGMFGCGFMPKSQMEFFCMLAMISVVAFSPGAVAVPQAAATGKFQLSPAPSGAAHFLRIRQAR